MTVNTKLDYQSYLTCVEALADSFFDEDGNYAPHLGRIMSVSLFLDFCVKDSGISMEDDNMIDQIFSNEEITKAFDQETQDYANFETCGLTFANAYVDALEIVKQRNNSIINALNLFAGQIKQIASPENIEALQEASKNLDTLLNNNDNVVSLFPNKAE